MRPKQILRMSVDVLMTALFLVLMAYHITGNRLHEWLGILLYVLFLLHHVLNRKWIASLLKGRYNAVRILMLTINVLLFAAMLGMMISGALLSRDALRFLNLRAGMFGRRLHMISTAWGYVLMSMHIGLHFGTMLNAIRKKGSAPKKEWILVGRCLLIGLLAYGVYAFFVRQIPDRMLLLMEYAFFDYREPAVLFFADYLTILILFATLTYALMTFFKKMKRRNNS